MQRSQVLEEDAGMFGSLKLDETQILEAVLQILTNACCVFTITVSYRYSPKNAMYFTYSFPFFKPWQPLILLCQ